MKRLLFTFLILGSGAQAVPKNAFAALCATVSISGFAVYLSDFLTPKYDMQKKPVIIKKLKDQKNNKAVNFEGYHTAVNADNDTYDYQLRSTELNLWNTADKIGHAYFICTRQSATQPRECTMNKLRIKPNYRYQGLGSLLLQEAVHDLKKRTSVDELNFIARAQEGTSQERLENFYHKNGASQKDARMHEKEFIINVNKV